MGFSWYFMSNEWNSLSKLTWFQFIIWFFFFFFYNEYLTEFYPQIILAILYWVWTSLKFLYWFLPFLMRDAKVSRSRTLLLLKNNKQNTFAFKNNFKSIRVFWPHKVFWIQKKKRSGILQKLERQKFEFYDWIIVLKRKKKGLQT